jgi:hypothetical protein
LTKNNVKLLHARVYSNIFIAYFTMCIRDNIILMKLDDNELSLKLLKINDIITKQQNKNIYLFKHIMIFNVMKSLFKFHFLKMRDY